MGQYTHMHGSAQDDRSLSRWAAEDEEFSTLYPALYEFLCEQVDEEGKLRVTSTILLTCEDGLFKVCLIDRAQKGSNFEYTLWKSGKTLSRALAAIDESLRDNTAEWRKRAKWEPKKRG